MNISAAELMLNDADDLLAKACINEKGQKTLIKNLATEQREDIVKDCSPKAALKAVLNQTFLATPEGRKLARDLIRKIGIDIVWKNVKIMIKDGSATKRYCSYFGQTLIVLWKKFEKEESEDENINENSHFEHVVFEELFRLAICTQRSISEKFLAVINGVVDGRSVSISQMLFRTSNHVLWRTLDAPNMVCRYNSASVFLRLYPLDAAAEENLDYDLKEKQHEVLLQLMKDDCFQIRVDTIKAVFNYLSLFWPLLKSFHRKTYLTTIIDELVYDETAEIRLAVYESFPLLYSCAAANTVVEYALKLITPFGLTDPKDKIRLATVNALLQLQNHSISCLQVIKLEELLACLDVETCDEVEIGLTQLLLPFLCKDGGVSLDDRFHSVEQACRFSRNGPLKFHKIIGAKKMISNQLASQQIRTIMAGVTLRLKLKDDSNNESTLSSSASNETTKLDFDESRPGVDFSVVKNCIDCAAVLFVSVRSRLNDDPDAKYYAGVKKSLGRFVSKIMEHPRYKSNILGESALVLATFLPQNALNNNARFFINGVLEENWDCENMHHYVLTFAMWDMDQLIRIIERGLIGIAKKFKLDKKVHQQRRNNFNDLAADSSKDKDRKPIEIIAIILSSPPTNEYLFKNFEVFAQRFHSILKVLVENMPSLIENSLEELWTRIYEIYSLLTIGIKSQVNAGNPECSTMDADDDDNSEPICDTFESELQWFYKRFNAKELTSSFITRFINLAKYHFDCNQQKESSCESILTLCNHISSFLEASENAAEAKSKINALRKAALDAFPFTKKQPELAVIQEEDEEEEEAVIEEQQQQQSPQQEQHQQSFEAMETD